MKNNERLYSTLVLFGREAPRSVASPEFFDDLLGDIIDLMQTTGCKLVARGNVAGENGVKLAPRAALWSGTLRDSWLKTLERGGARFSGIQLFDEAFRSGDDPGGFATVHKFWKYVPNGYVETSSEGAENNITIALGQDLVPGAFERLRGAARAFCEKIGGFYGSIESSVPWARPVGRGFEDMIDVRWQMRTAVDYLGGKYKVHEMIPRLYRGNILCPSQFVSRDFNEIGKLPGVVKVEQWPLDLTYLQLTEEPAYGAKAPPEFANYIRFIPESTRNPQRRHY